MIGLLTTGSSGLGWLAVIGRSLVPSPPAITSAFTACRLPSLPLCPIIAGLPLPCQRGLPLAGFPAAAHARDDLACLGEVEGGRPPVQCRSPDREGPADDPGGQRGGTVVGAEEQQRERVEQAQGGRLPQEADLKRADVVVAQHEQGQPE